MSRVLRLAGFDSIEAESGEEALERLALNSIDVVLLDVMMPGIDGFETCRRIRAQRSFGHVPVVFVTALGDRDSRVLGTEVGGNDFIVKPIDDVELVARVRNLALMRQYYRRLESERESLEQRVQQQHNMLLKARAEIDKAQQSMRHYHEEILFRLSKAVEFRDDETANHVQRMSRYCKIIATKLGMEKSVAEAIRLTSALHDMGKIATPDGILRKPGALTDDEIVLMRRHAAMGHRLLTGSGSELLEMAATIAWTHHERFDGNGYPEKIVGERIPIEGRIAAVADVFDALTSNRVYKRAMPVERAVEILEEERGAHFDPVVVDAFLDQRREISAIMTVYKDR